MFHFKTRILFLFTRTNNYETARQRRLELCQQTVCCFYTVSAVNEGYRRSRFGRSLKLNELATKKGHGPTNIATSSAFSLSLFSFFIVISVGSGMFNIFAACVRARTRSQKFRTYFAWRIEDRVEQLERAITGDAVSFGTADGHD